MLEGSWRLLGRTADVLAQSPLSPSPMKPAQQCSKPETHRASGLAAACGPAGSASANGSPTPAADAASRLAMKSGARDGRKVCYLCMKRIDIAPGQPVTDFYGRKAHVNCIEGMVQERASAINKATRLEDEAKRIRLVKRKRPRVVDTYFPDEPDSASGALA